MVSLFGRLMDLVNRAKILLKLLPDLLLVNTSSLFDRDWYLKKNPDAANWNDPLKHYVLRGGFEGRDPSPGFSSSSYLVRYEEVRKAGINPLVHYLKYGRFHGRKVESLEFDALNPYQYQQDNFSIDLRHLQSVHPKPLADRIRQITFFVSEPAQLQAIESVAKCAITRGYEVRISNDVKQPAEVGVYCGHKPDSINSRFSVVMLHDIGQSQWPESPSREPNLWKSEPWNGFDIGILPGPAWSQCWSSVSFLPDAKPRLGVFELGWPKSDRIFNNPAEFSNEVRLLRESLRLKDQPTVIYAPSFENDGKLDDFIGSLIHMPINLLIKYWVEPRVDKRSRIIELMDKLKKMSAENIYIIDPLVNIMDCLALSDVLVSDESNCFIEALLFEVPGITVTDWVMPLIASSTSEKRKPDPPSIAIKTTRAELQRTVEQTLRNRDGLRPSLRQNRDHYFKNLGYSSILIMDVIEAGLTGSPWPVEPLKPKELADLEASS